MSLIVELFIAILLTIVNIIKNTYLGIVTTIVNVDGYLLLT